MRDLLVRYLLGELDDQERRHVEEQLRNSPELQRELVYLHSCLPPAADADQPTEDPSAEPPLGLAERTAQRVTDTATGTEDSAPFLGLGGIMSSSSADVDHATNDSPRWSFADLTVAAGVLLAISMLMLPAMRESRDAARRTYCQNNMRQLGAMLANYSYENRHYFPLVGPRENAGVFAVRLVDNGVVTPDELASLLVCPSSPLAEEMAKGRITVLVPCSAQVRLARGQELAQLQRVMGGSYAYRIGYIEGDRYYGIRNENNRFSPLLADTPSLYMAGYTSANHGGYGQNVLYQDLSVRYQSGCTVPDQDDHLYLNAANIPAAGRHRFDAVLSRSEATPGIVPALHVP